MLKNYRPASNLPFLSKFPEHLVAKQLECYLDTYILHDNHQYAYHTGRSRETALLNVHQDIAEARNNKCVAEFFKKGWDIVLE